MPSTINGAPAGTTGDDTFTGTAGNDVINMISTGTGADGGTGHDVAFGGAGNDRIISDGGDVIYGGAGGIDIADLRLQNSTANFVIDLSQELAQTDNTANVLYDIGDHKTFINSIEQLFFYGGSGDDLIKGGAYADRLDGGGGHNSIYGGGGADQIFGHNGDVTVIVYSGPNQQPDATIDGGAGTDTLFYNATNFTSATTIDITAATTSPGGTTISGFEVLNDEGSNYGDTVHAAGGDDTLWGGTGDDFLFGGAGNNQLDGKGGNDGLPRPRLGLHLLRPGARHLRGRQRRHRRARQADLHRERAVRRRRREPRAQRLHPLSVTFAQAMSKAPPQGGAFFVSGLGGRPACRAPRKPPRAAGPVPPPTARSPR